MLSSRGEGSRFSRQQGLKKGDRCALLAHNSIDWVALDLAIMAEGLIVVPLYARQAPAELVAMMKDCSPALICCGDDALRDGIHAELAGSASAILFEEIFAQPEASAPAKPQLCRFRSGCDHLYLGHFG